MSKTRPARAARSLATERRFREKVTALGGTVVELEWLGQNKPHRVICAAGHPCSPRPVNVLKEGRGVCPACAGNDSAESRFRAKVQELGGTVAEPVWRGSRVLHHVVCPEGHEATVYPTNLLRGTVLCRICARKDSKDAWRRFRERVVEFGGVVVEPEWLGKGKPHRVICRAGHECTPYPTNVLRREGLCRICAGNDPEDAWRRFRERVAELGGRVVETRWLGRARPYRVICAAGHECAPWGSSVLTGGGLCLVCSRSASDAFYVVENETLDVIKVGITTGEGAMRLRKHRYDGFTIVLRYLQELDDAALLEANTLKTLEAAGVEPVRGLEYFERVSALPVVLDIVDNWIISEGGTDDVEAGRAQRAGFRVLR